MLILVSRLEKLVHVYKDGVLIGISTCTMGDEHRTPMGIFTLGSRYGDADLSSNRSAGEDAERGLTWPATALHAVNLNVRSPDCVRVPAPFAQLLSSVARPGALFIVTDRHTVPNLEARPDALLPIEFGNESRRRSPLSPRAFDLTASEDNYAVFISRADRQAVLLRDGNPEKRFAVSINQPRTPIGTHVFSLLGLDESNKKLRWLGLGLGRSYREDHLEEWRGEAVLNRISFAEKNAAAEITGRLHAGATIIVTDAPGGTASRSPSRDVVVLAASGAPLTHHAPRPSQQTRHSRPPRPSVWAKAFPDSGT